MGKSAFVSDRPQVELFGIGCALVGDCEGILEYESQTVKLRAGKRILRFFGRDLTLCDLSDQTVQIRGVITSLEFEG